MWITTQLRWYLNLFSLLLGKGLIHLFPSFIWMVQN